MLTLNDFREKQILFIQNSHDNETEIKFRNENVVYLKDKKIVNQISCYKILAIFMIGDSSLTTVFIREAVKFGISVFLMKNNFETYAIIESKAEGNYLLRMKQYDNTKEFLMAKNLIKNKVLNQITLLKQEKAITNDECKNNLKEVYNKIENAKNEKELLGLEGNYSKNFFGNYFSELKWKRRLPRTKFDEYNLLLDMGYTFLLNYIDSLLRLYGFDVYKGFYHKLFFKRKSLSCDIMEPFRCIIDRQLLKSFRLKQIDKKDFKFSNGHFFLSYDQSQKYAKIFLDGILKYKENIFDYTYSFYKFMIDDNNEFPFFEMK